MDRFDLWLKEHNMTLAEYLILQSIKRGVEDAKAGRISHTNWVGGETDVK